MNIFLADSSGRCYGKGQAHAKSLTTRARSQDLIGVNDT
jgi:hypothetical protein